MVSAFLLAAVLHGPPASEGGALDPQLLAGIRKVREGDFEDAVSIFEGTIPRLLGPPERGRELVQAYLYLGIAHVALGKNEAARLDFREALARDQNLRLSPETFSPKVISVFQQAQAEFAPRKEGGRKTAWIIAGIGGAAAAGVLVARGSSGTGTLSLTNARFGIDVVVCPAGTDNGSIPFSILVDAVNGNAPTDVSNVTTTLVIVNSPALPSEVGFLSTRPSAVVPATLLSGATTTLRVDSSLFCGNSGEGSARFNEWVGRLTLTTTSGVFTLETTDQLHVNIP
jgi:hypothetical protein